MACSCAACNHVHSEPHNGGSHESVWNKNDIIRFSTAAVFFVIGIALKVIGDPFKISLIIGSAPVTVTISTILFIGTWLAAGLEIMETTIKNIGKESIFDENFLMTFATIGAFVLGEWSEGAAVMLFYNLGELLQAAAVQQSRRSITGLMDLRPEFVRLYQSDKTPSIHAEQEKHRHEDCGHSHAEHTHGDHSCCCHDHAEDDMVAPEEVAVGTLILVKPGEKVPLDGILIEGACSFDTSSMTGESVPRFSATGETVLAGFVNMDGLAVIKTTATADETAAAKMLELVEHAQDRKAKTERLISRFARVYTPIVTISAVLLALLPPLILSAVRGTPLLWDSFVPWISRGLVFLVISCPCAFVISVPLGYFSGLGGAAKKGILIKGADFIDALAKTDSVVFDKTGTLTAGILTVQRTIPSESVSMEVLLELAYLAEYHSGHPIAKAVKNFAQEQLGSKRTAELEKEAGSLAQYTEKAGSGVSMLWQGKELKAGSALFVLGNANKQPDCTIQTEGTKVFISYGGVYAGCVICSDSIKAQSAQAIHELRSAGVSYLEMLTGDSKSTGEKIAQALQLDRCSSELLPHEKVARFEAISTERKKQNPDAVCVFAGDGINDAPVLARADVGIAMGGIGSDAAIEAADVILMTDNPQLIPQAVKSARFTRKIVMQNIALSFAVKAAFLAGGALGIIDLWVAVFADVGVALLAVCNSMRARR